jgi:glutaredoxin-like protein
VFRPGGNVLNAAVQRQVRKALESMTSPVTVAVFTVGDGEPHTCEICEDTRQLVEEVAFLSDGKVVATSYDLTRDAEVARRYGVDAAPAVVLLDGSGRDYGIRFFGIPTGYEFATLIADITMLSSGDHGLRPDTVALLNALKAPVNVQVFVTPTCPYCPPAVHLAHRLAFAGDRVTASLVAASEFPDLADRYDVHAVPLTVVNGTIRLEGSMPEADVAAALRALIAEAKTA